VVKSAFAVVLFGALVAPALAQTTPPPSAPGSPMPSNDSGSMGSSTMPLCVAGDRVVWVYPGTKIYYLKGQTPYGKTAGGTYKCLSSVKGRGYTMYIQKKHAPNGAPNTSGSSTTSGENGGTTMGSPAATATGGTTTTNATPTPAASPSSAP
jgi:hypothetical protein